MTSILSPRPKKILSDIHSVASLPCYPFCRHNYTLFQTTELLSKYNYKGFSLSARKRHNHRNPLISKHFHTLYLSTLDINTTHSSDSTKLNCAATQLVSLSVPVWRSVICSHFVFQPRDSRTTHSTCTLCPNISTG